MNSESTDFNQILSSRINEVHCGILKHVERYRNSLHSCGMTQLRELSLVNSESTNNKQKNDNKVDTPLTKDNSQNSLSPLTETLVVNPLHNSLFGVYLAYENCYLRRK